MRWERSKLSGWKRSLVFFLPQNNLKYAFQTVVLIIYMLLYCVVVWFSKQQTTHHHSFRWNDPLKINYNDQVNSKKQNQQICSKNAYPNFLVPFIFNCVFFALFFSLLKMTIVIANTCKTQHERTSYPLKSLRNLRRVLTNLLLFQSTFFAIMIIAIATYTNNQYEPSGRRGQQTKSNARFNTRWIRMSAKGKKCVRLLSVWQDGYWKRS